MKLSEGLPRATNTKLCPECREPPHYHSFCTRCAKRFQASGRNLDDFWRKRETGHARRGRPRSYKRKWNAEKVALLRALRNREHLTRKTMAARLNVTLSALDMAIGRYLRDGRERPFEG